MRYNSSMRSKDALRALAEITAYQWGMVTSAQASMQGVTRLDLSRLAADGLLERLAHGVYKTTASPSDDLDRLRAAWLSTDPKRLAHERRIAAPDAVLFAGASAARIHGIGDLWDDHFDFITPVRRQSQRSDVRYRKRTLDPRDVTSVDGLPVLTVEATIADLVAAVGDLSLVAGTLRDAWRKGDLDTTRLTELLGPVTLTRLTELAGVGQVTAHG
jgi:predicted transcriptional regulator of viral defense system